MPDIQPAILTPVSGGASSGGVAPEAATAPADTGFSQALQQHMPGRDDGGAPVARSDHGPVKGHAEATGAERDHPDPASDEAERAGSGGENRPGRATRHHHKVAGTGDRRTAGRDGNGSRLPDERQPTAPGKAMNVLAQPPLLPLQPGGNGTKSESESTGPAATKTGAALADLPRGILLRALGTADARRVLRGAAGDGKSPKDAVDPPAPDTALAIADWADDLLAKGQRLLDGGPLRQAGNRIFQNLVAQLQPVSPATVSSGDGAAATASVGTAWPAPAGPTAAGPTVAAAPGPALHLATPVQHPAWGQAVGDRVLWLVNHRLQQADIKLNPPHLGPLEVRIQVHNDQTQVSFSTHHALVREALEAALPRLRDMLVQNGMGQLDVNVSQQGFQQAQDQAGQAASRSTGGPAGPTGEGDDLGGSARHSVSLVLPGGLDLFA